MTASLRMSPQSPRCCGGRIVHVDHSLGSGHPSAGQPVLCGAASVCSLSPVSRSCTGGRRDSHSRLDGGVPPAGAPPGRPGSYPRGSSRRASHRGRVRHGPYGDPIPDLGPADFRVRVDGKPVELESADWIPADLPELPVRRRRFPPRRMADRSRSRAPGRLIVFFFQTDFDPSRLVGLVRMSLQARRFLDDSPSHRPRRGRLVRLAPEAAPGLHQRPPEDREALYDAIRTGEPGADRGPDVPFPRRRALRLHAPPETRRRRSAGSSCSRGRSLRSPGGKTMLFFGWGLGRSAA